MNAQRTVIAIQIGSSPIILGVIGLVSVWTDQAILVPSLASATFIQILAPETSSAAPWNIVIGQLVGALSGFAAVYLCAANHLPQFMTGHLLLLPRVEAVALAAALTTILQIVMGCRDAAGGTLAVLIAVGAETPDTAGAIRLSIGITAVVLMGQLVRHLVLKAASPNCE